MSMLKKVRDAIYDAASGPECLGISEQLAEKFARAAILAMREPTGEMLAAMSPSGRYADIVLPEQWQAAIDVALKD